MVRPLGFGGVEVDEGVVLLRMQEKVDWFSLVMEVVGSSRRRLLLGLIGVSMLESEELLIWEELVVWEEVISRSSSSESRGFGNGFD